VSLSAVVLPGLIIGVARLVPLTARLCGIVPMFIAYSVPPGARVTSAG